MGLNRRVPSAQLGLHSTELSVPVPRAPSAPHELHAMSSMTPVVSQLYANEFGRCSGGWLGSKHFPMAKSASPSSAGSADAMAGPPNRATVQAARASARITPGC